MIPMRNRHTNINCRKLHKLKQEARARPGGMVTIIDLTKKVIVR